MRDRGEGWNKLVLGATILLLVIFIFKVVFWISVVCLVVGLLWFLVDQTSGNWDHSSIPYFLIAGGIFGMILAYPIGYGFEQSELGKPIVKAAETIVQTDQTLEEVKENVTIQTLNSVSNVTQEVVR